MSRTEGSREEARSAAQYYRGHRIPERVEEALNTGYRLQPPDLLGYLSNYFAELSMPPVISGVRGRKVLGGAGSAALEVEVFCTVRNKEKRICSTVISADPATPLTCHEAEEKERAMSVETAIGWIRETIGPLLGGTQPTEQSDIDQILSDFFQPKLEEERRRRDNERDAAALSTRSAPTPPISPAAGKKKGSGKGKKAAAAEKSIPPADPPEPVIRGSLAVSAVSLAVATSAAILRDVPLYSYVSAMKHGKPPSEVTMPTPLITMMSCGKASPGKLNLMKEIMVVPRPGLTAQQAVDLASSLQAEIINQMDGVCKGGAWCTSVAMPGCLVFGAERMDQPLDLMRGACERLGLQLGGDVYVAINCAAYELMDENKGKYEIIGGVWKSPEEMVDLYVDLLGRHPAIVALVDPLRKEDAAQWEALGKAVSSRCYLIADVASKTAPGPQRGDPVLSSGAVLKYTNHMTISDLLEAVQLMEGQNRVTVLGCPQEESSGSSVVDLAVALGSRFVMLGGLLRGERTAKYNRLVAIEEELGQIGMLGLHTTFDFPMLWPSEEICNTETKPSL
ncbi:enolase 4 isoform X2 [Pyxicephalus adspersus]|uniref:enolase 4 isoform X2 n=1 Tax=Pyxicephalus adspersus TaxID=30357 RepID=UPI003B5B07AC